MHPEEGDATHETGGHSHHDRRASARLASCGAVTVSPSSAATDAGSPATGCSSDAIADDAGQLTGVWTADDGGRYYLRQMGDCIWWFRTELQEVGDGDQSGFANVAVGRWSIASCGWNGPMFLLATSSEAGP